MENQKFCNILIRVSLRPIYHVIEALQTVISTHCGWYYCGRYCVDKLCIDSHSVCGLKAAQMNVQRNLIRKLMPYEFELCFNATETIKKIGFVKGEGTIDYNIVIRWFKKFQTVCKNFDD